MMEEHDERVFTLMMEALDGELTEAGWAELESHLRVRPDIAREWQALQAIDQLFRSTPALSPAAGFAQRTLAQLPNSRTRLWFVTSFYVLLLISGLIPLLFVGWITTRLIPALLEPALIRSLIQAGSEIFRVIGVVTSAVLAGSGNLLQQQPAVIGWLLVMAGIVLVWGGIYRQLVSAPHGSSVLE
jgi:anti-sigma factor RsiW